MDISLSPYHISFKSICEHKKKWIESIYYFKWEKLNNRFWDFNFFPNIDHFAMARGSGLISRDSASYFDSNSKPHVYLFDSYSQLVWDLVVDHRCNHAMSQALPNDSVLVLTDDGFFYCYQYQQLSVELSLKLNYKTTSVMSVDFWDKGFVCLLTNGDIFECINFQAPTKLRHFDEIGKPECFHVVPPSKSVTGNPIVYLLTQNGQIMIISKDQCFTIDFEDKITNIALSANFTKIALLTTDLILIVATLDMTEIIYKKQLESNEFFDVLNMSWVGDIAPVVCFKGAVVLGTNDDTGQPMWTLESEEDYSFGFTDVDSCFICTSGASYRLTFIPDRIVNVFDKEIEDNFAFRLCKIFDNRHDKPSINAIVTKVGTNDIIDLAASDVLEAAEFFVEADIQDFLLNAACLALTYIKRTNPLYEVVTRIKIMNMVRKIALLPVTASQIFDIGIDALLMRLMNREFFFLAIDIAHILHYPIHTIQKQYIDRTVHNIMDDDACFNTISEHQDIDYGYAAVCAAQNKRRKLALEFCKLEPHFSRKAMIFAQIGEWSEALKNAEASCDGSALFNVLVLLFESSDIDAVNLAVAQNEVAAMFLVNNYGFVDEARTTAIANLVDSKSAFADMKLRAAVLRKEVPTSLQGAFKPLIKLQEQQRSLAEKKNNPAIVEMTFNDTVRYLINGSDDEEAFLLAKACEIPNVNVAVIGIQYLSRLGRWNRLKVFILQKKWDSLWPLVIEVALANNAMEFAILFAKEVSVIERKQDLINQLESGAFGISTLESKSSYQKKLFRRSLFQISGY